MDNLDSFAERASIDHAYKGFYVDNRTSKETTQGRFSDIDDNTLHFISGKSHPLIHDVGISNGITSVDLYRRLSADHRSFKLFVSDKFAHFYRVGTRFCRIYDRNDKLTRAYIFSIVADKNLHWKYFLSKYSYQLIRAIPYHRQHAVPIMLYDPSLRLLLHEGKIFEIEYDVFNTSHPPDFDLVRCMNVLNLSYFSPAEISKAIINLTHSLKEGGVLQIGRTTPEGLNNASFFKKVHDQLILVEDVNEGSEIKELTLLGWATKD